MKSIIAELEAYLETEMHYFKAGLDKETDPIQRSNIAWYCMQRCLGACQFANQLGGDFSIIEPMFEFYKEKIEKYLLTNNRKCDTIVSTKERGADNVHREK